MRNRAADPSRAVFFAPHHPGAAPTERHESYAWHEIATAATLFSVPTLCGRPAAQRQRAERPLP
ncbi:hypothetical protein BX591_11687 [Paraburkholderia bryophila]|uniref:Uncharacterized protein n=1 Tax=Paraburkholderia bryophila TaxID=420952 RepID=A0A329BT00_9BURK|nr:hypothetical protein BX591_11687 [Paraburkholderia bryophila]